MKVRASLWLAPLLATTAAAQTLIIPTSDTRTVSALAYEGDHSNPTQQDNEVIVASGFGLFQATAHADVSSSPDGFVSSFAQIDSNILGDQITVTGNTAGNGGASGEFYARGLMEGIVTFDVPASCRYRFHGFVEGYDSGIGSTFLRDASGTGLGGVFGIAEGVVPFDRSGTLTPGTYTVDFRGNGSYSSSGGYGSTRLDITLDLLPMGESYCTSSPNSSGNAATLDFSGTTNLSDNDFALHGQGGPPGAFGLFLFSPFQAALALGNGTLCLGSPFRRLGDPVPTGANGQSSLPLNLNTGPLAHWNGGVQPGTTWNFQWIFRDSVGLGLDLSNGLQLNFFQ